MTDGLTTRRPRTDADVRLVRSTGPGCPRRGAEPTAVAETGLFSDWALGSLQAFQLVIVLETLADCLVPPPDIPDLLQLGDAYADYEELVRSAAADEVP